ncbi:non-ribosomal peptide synthetase [Streptomyces leeuwenhoekii]|uniref:Linear gramicidin synthase subunit C n=3 Tax=Streptomyces leeuwenhoekii TaxID=1437453 RepID=A0A0F7VNF3_STRLW|nr:non-ribosomal peptide synthetase [Streptomyces leeuwenhoekii]CQR61654.1 Linear gramicidin synthase subunit C [Streptomyces leeuwenhoekii]
MTATVDETGTLDDVLALVAGRLGRPSEGVDPDGSFVASGADSLALLALARDVHTRFGVRVPVRHLFDDMDTPRKLARALGARTDGPAGAGPSAPRPPADEPSADGPFGVQPGAAGPFEAEPFGAEPAAAGPLPGEPRAGAPVEQGPASLPVAAPPAAPVPLAPATRTAPYPDGDAPDPLLAVLNGQLELAEKMMINFSELAREQLRVLDGRRPDPGPTTAAAPPAPSAVPSAAPSLARAARPAPAPTPAPVPARAPAPTAPTAPQAAPAATQAVVDRSTGRQAPDFSLYFFGDYPHGDAAAAYGHLLSAAAFADEHGFHTLWLPERHFHSFGALFPNPAVLAAALATRTSRIRIHAGSVVLPLHDPIRVAEEWSVVDNLSGGRVGLGVASGWHSTDFVLAPENYGRQREVMYEHLDTVRGLWAGRAVAAKAGDGTPVEVTVHPRPVQADLPLFTAVLSNPGSYERAGRAGLGVVTNLMAQSTDDLRANIARYRAARAAAGLDPAGGRVVVLVHTYLGADAERARAEARRPFCDYLRSSVDLFDNVANSLGIDVDLRATDPEDVDFVLGRAYETYCAQRALIGSADSVRPVLDALASAGADEIGCFVDFGVAPELMLGALPELARLRAEYRAPASGRPAASAPAPGTPSAAPAPAVPSAPVPSAPAAVSAPAAPSGPYVAPASPLQRRMWLLDRMAPGSHTYYEPKALLIEGPLDTDVLRLCLRRVVARHPQLRTVFREHDGELRQVVLDDVRVDCPVTSLTGCDDETALLRLRDMADEEPDFDLATGPLLRARIGRLGDDRHLLYLVAHHIVFDALSTRILCRDLAAHYRAWPGEPDDLPALPALPGVVPAPSAPRPDGLDFWRRELAGAVPLDLPTDRPRDPGHPARGASLAHELDAALSEEIRAAGRAAGCTPFMVLVAAVGSVLGRFAGQDDVVLGTAVTNRPPGAEDSVGMFVETVALRLDLSGDPGFAELLHRVRSGALRALDHHDVPFDQVVEAVRPDRTAGGNPLFGVMVEYEEESGPVLDGTGLAAELLDVPREQAPFDLTLYFTDRAEGIRCAVEYDAELFDAPTVRRILEYIEDLLRNAAQAPSVALSRLPALTARDERTLEGWQGERIEHPAACLHELVEAQAVATPDAVAVDGCGEPLTYRRLDAAANRLAHRLAARGLEHGDTAAVCLPRGADLVVAVLAVLKCGAVYVPVDRSLPAERRAFMLRDSGARLVVADRAVDGEESFPCPVQWIDDPETAEGAEEPLGRPVAPDDLAYCIYTSGSTGTPKAVAVPHRGPVNLVHWQRRALGSLRTVQWASAGFDVSVQEIFTTLGSGATLVVLDDETRYDPAAVAEHLRRHSVERLSAPYTPLTYLLPELVKVPSLRQLLIGGEKLTVTPALRDLAERCPRLEIYNQYGPTEASVIVTSHRVDPATETVAPIGRPLDNVTLVVADRSGRPAPIGAPGELVIGGAPVARGYLGDPEATARSFLTGPEGAERRYRTGDLVRWRSDGVLQYIGRIDDQVKIRGHRVEPEEAQWALVQLDEVRDAVVLARPDAAGETELAAFVVPRPEEPGAADTGGDWSAPLRARLAERLPHYLVPQTWIRLDGLPHGPNGKLDRERLLGLRAGDPAGDSGAPLTGLEQKVHDLWVTELGTGPIAPDRSFFDVGGNSLSAVRLLERLRGELGPRVPVAVFFADPTIRGVAARVAALREEGTP